MSLSRGLLEIEFLIFSSHKTATQSMVHSLGACGVLCRHCHTLGNIGLREGELDDYLRAYQQANARRLQIVTVFRDPLERMVSSFFQTHGTDPLNAGEADSEEQTVIYRRSIGELQPLFIDYCETCDGYGESIHAICEELGLRCEALVFRPRDGVGVNDLERCRLYLLRFDLLTQRFSDLLSRVAGKTIVGQEQNASVSKWYGHRYLAFKQRLRLPDSVITAIYRSRADLMNIFYPGRYEAMLSAAIGQYGGQRANDGQ